MLSLYAYLFYFADLQIFNPNNFVNSDNCIIFALLSLIKKRLLMTDIEIANSINLERIENVAKSLGINPDDLENYGKYIAKIPLKYIDEDKAKNSNLILVTSVSPTKAGIGKTTVSIGLALGLSKIGKKCVVALREPSLGPCFGIKGGACGGGYAQVLPMEKINLHFTGDFHAVTTAHNMITALMDNYFYQNRATVPPLKQVLWKRVLDVNDRGLRNIVSGLGGALNGIPQESGFDITPASEIMAILCLATSLDDLRNRIDNILLGITADNKEFYVKDLGVTGSIVALLIDAIKPNLVQTTENTPAIIHGGPFANIAHGCNTILATKMALSLSDYVVTEAGFGADLGAEKFFDIKCRKMGIYPKLVVLVATVQGLKLNGMENLDQHVENLRKFNSNILVAFNRYAQDTDEEIQALVSHCENDLGLKCVINDAYMNGGSGAVELASAVVSQIQDNKAENFPDAIYAGDADIKTKIENVCKEIYRAGSVSFASKALKKLQEIQADPYYAKFPVCIAKTQYSFSDDPKLIGCPKYFVFTISDIVINRGAEFIVPIAGTMMRMPGLPKEPCAKTIDVVDGNIVGLS